MVSKPAEQIAELRGRVAELEFVVRELKRRLDETFGPKTPWWENAAGCMPDDDAYADFLEALRKNREADYAAAGAEADRSETEERPTSKRQEKGQEGRLSGHS